MTQNILAECALGALSPATIIPKECSNVFGNSNELQRLLYSMPVELPGRGATQHSTRGG